MKLIMDLTYLLLTICITCTSTKSFEGNFRDFKPDYFTIDKLSGKLKNSAKIIFEANAPDGTNVVHVAAEAIEDLTGNVPEEGYKFPYNEAIPFVYYPEIMEGTAMVYKLRFGRKNDDGTFEWTQWLEESGYHKTDRSEYVLIKLNRSWEDAKEWCLDHNMRLASVLNEKQRKEVINLMESHNDGDTQITEAWIGLFDKNSDKDSTERDWAWVGGIPFKEQKNFFEKDGQGLERHEENGAPGFYNHVKFTREGNFKIAHIKDDATDKDEFICKIMETERVKRSELGDGGKTMLN